MQSSTRLAFTVIWDTDRNEQNRVTGVLTVTYGVYLSGTPEKARWQWQSFQELAPSAKCLPELSLYS